MLNKKQANLWVKIVALVIAIAFIAIGAVGLIQPGMNLPPANQQSSQGSAADQQAQQMVIALQGQLKANPTSVVLQRQLANAYDDWGRRQLNENRQQPAQTNFLLAADAYRKVLGKTPKDTNVRTDFATALFYSGDASGAITQVGIVLKEKPTHQGALMNAGVFYATVGNSAKARELWQKYLQLYPNTPQATEIKKLLANLK